MPAYYRTRFIEKRDVAEVLRIEKRSNTSDINTDFGPVPCTNHWALDEKELMDLIRERAVAKLEPGGGTYTFVVEEDSNVKTYAQLKTVGGFSYEKSVDSYEVIWVTAEVNRIKEVYGEVIRYMRGLAEKSESRKKAVFYVRDRDEAHLRSILPIFQGLGAEIKLIKDFYQGNTDAWRCTFTSNKTIWDEKEGEMQYV